MARKSPLQKLQASAQDLAKVRNELATFDAMVELAETSNIELLERTKIVKGIEQVEKYNPVVEKLENFRIRCRADEEYLGKQIRGIIARDANLDMLIQNAAALLK